MSKTVLQIVSCDSLSFVIKRGNTKIMKMPSLIFTCFETRNDSQRFRTGRIHPITGYTVTLGRHKRGVDLL
jgi:hypothetical protein